MLSTGVVHSESKIYPFKAKIDVDRLFETKEKAETYVIAFLKFDESVRERL